MKHVTANLALLKTDGDVESQYYEGDGCFMIMQLEGDAGKGKVASVLAGDISVVAIIAATIKAAGEERFQRAMEAYRGTKQE